MVFISSNLNDLSGHDLNHRLTGIMQGAKLSEGQIMQSAKLCSMRRVIMQSATICAPWMIFNYVPAHHWTSFQSCFRNYIFDVKKIFGFGALLFKHNLSYVYFPILVSLSLWNTIVVGVTYMDTLIDLKVSNLWGM